MMPPKTIWYPHPGSPEYEISTEGGIRFANGEELELHQLKSGYAYYALPDDEIPDHFIHVTPDNVINNYLPDITDYD